MSRTLHHLYAPHLSAQAVKAASLIWARTRESDKNKSQLEILLTKRSQKASFAPGAYVFPGGKIDPKDQTYAQRYLNLHPTSPLSLDQATHACTALTSLSSIRT